MVPAFCFHAPNSRITVRKSRPYRSALAAPTPLTARSSAMVRGREMAISRPRTMAELRAVSGVGAAKAERYGRDFLTVIREFGA